MRARYVLGLTGGFAVTAWGVGYAATQGGHPFGLFVAALVGISATCVGVFLTSWLIDHFRPYKRKKDP